MEILGVDAGSLVGGGISGVGFSAMMFKLFLTSIMSHIDTLKKQNSDCESRYTVLRKDFTDLQDKFIKYMGDRSA